MQQTMIQTIPKMVSISDLQRRAKTVFRELAVDQPTVVLNRNRSIGVVIKPELYEHIMQQLEDLYDGVYLERLVKQSKSADFCDWEKVEKELIKADKLT